MKECQPLRRHYGLPSNTSLDLVYIEHRIANRHLSIHILLAAILLHPPIFFLCGSHAFYYLNFPPPPRL